MSLATALQDQLAHNPWPPAAQQVIFLLDTTRRFERQLLEQWIAVHDSHAANHTLVPVSYTHLTLPTITEV